MTGMVRTTKRSLKVVASRVSAIGFSCHNRTIQARNGTKQVGTSSVCRCVPTLPGTSTHHAYNRGSTVATVPVSRSAGTVVTVNRPHDRVTAIPNLRHASAVAYGVLRWGRLLDTHVVHSDNASR